METINTFIHFRSFLENHIWFQTKLGKVYAYFQTKTTQKPTCCGNTYLYGLYKGVPPPPRQLLLCVSLNLRHINGVFWLAEE